MKNIIVLETIYEGGTFPGAEISIVDDTTGTSVPVVLTGADIEMQLWRDGRKYDTYSTANGKITIGTGDNTHKFYIISHEPTIPAGIYDFDFNIIMGDTTIEPGIGRGQWELLEPITKRE